MTRGEQWTNTTPRNAPAADRYGTDPARGATRAADKAAVGTLAAR
jgi:hypothetical protein